MSSDLDCRAPHARACANLVPIPRALKNYCKWFVLADILLAKVDELNLNLPKFARPLPFFSSGLLALHFSIFRRK